MICTVLPDWLFSQLNHTATHFCLHFPVVTIMSQTANWVYTRKTLPAPIHNLPSQTKTPMQSGNQNYCINTKTGRLDGKNV